MNPKPVLRALQSLLRFKDNTTIAEIAGIAELPKAKVLDVINTNRDMLTIDRKTGKILAENLAANLRLKMYGEGLTYQLRDENYGADKSLQFAGHEEFRKTHMLNTWAGGLGDCYAVSYVPATPENIAALEAEGCIFINSVSYTLTADKLWKEINEKEVIKG